MVDGLFTFLVPDLMPQGWGWRGERLQEGFDTPKLHVPLLLKQDSLLHPFIQYQGRSTSFKRHACHHYI